MTSNTLIKVKIWALLALPLFIASTCEKPVTFKVDPPAPDLLVSSNFQDHSAIQVEVSKITYDAARVGQKEFINDAIVSIYEDNTLLEELAVVYPTTPRAQAVYSSSDIVPAIGKEYLIQVEVEGFRMVTARSIIPARVEIKDFTVGQVVETQTPESNLVFYNFPVYIAYDDPAGEENFYHLKIAQEIVEFSIIEGDTLPSRAFRRNINFSSELDDNFVNAYFAGGVLLQDDPFGGQYGFDMNVAINPGFQKLGRLFVELRTVSEEYYRFHNSLDRIEQQGGNTGGFQEAVIPYNNIENGSGIFAGYTAAMDSITIH
ncbi:MAG: DUF4249 domain-containing protein [Saprospiraceae bacterium]|nr:DUF4249 domain-containing protein [Saprospiraceae bacterium]